MCCTAYNCKINWFKILVDRIKNMSQFILIISTVIRTPFDLDSIKKAITGFSSIIEWSQDLDDTDKILRIVADEDISKKLVQQLERVEVHAVLLDVFEKRGGKLL